MLDMAKSQMRRTEDSWVLLLVNPRTKSRGAAALASAAAARGLPGVPSGFTTPPCRGRGVLVLVLVLDPSPMPAPRPYIGGLKFVARPDEWYSTYAQLGVNATAAGELNLLRSRTRRARDVVARYACVLDSADAAGTLSDTSAGTDTGSPGSLAVG